METDLHKLEYFYLPHQNNCLLECKRFKETKDKIVFFIGTLFITVLFGSGFLIYKSYDINKTAEGTNLLDKLYVVQYVLMHLFFFQLYLYYTYNYVQEKIFLTELQCCQNKIADTFKEYSSSIPVPFGFLKADYIDGDKTNSIFKVRGLKYFGNFSVVLIYFIFSAIPFYFQKNFILINQKGDAAGVTFNLWWIIIVFSMVVLLLVVIIIGQYLVNNTRKEIFKEWQLKDA